MFDERFNDGGEAGQDDRAAVYVSWPAFEKSLQQVRAAGVPDKLQRELLDPLFSHTVVTQALAAFRFLRLTDEGDRATPLLLDLVAAHGTPHWAPVLRCVLERAYPRIIALDLSRVTREQLDEAFKAYPGSSDAVRAKSVSFFLAAAREAGIPLSPDLAEPRRRSPLFNPRMLDELHRASQPHHGAFVMPAPNSLLAMVSPHAVEPPRNALMPPVLESQSRAAPYGAAFAALSAVWEPDTMPEDVDAAVVTVLRYLRRKEAEATKA